MRSSKLRLKGGMRAVTTLTMGLSLHESLHALNPVSMSQTLISAGAKLAKTDGVRDGSSYQSGGKDLVWLDAVSIVCHF